MNKKSIIKYSLLFILFFSSMIFFYIPFRMDTYVNYGFSYGIANGQIPYRDFNIIVPLFGPFLYSIGLLINKSIIVYYIEQAILLVAFCYCLFKLMKEKAWIVIVSLFCPFIFCFAYCIFPGYNFLILFELLLLLYFEENNKSDKLIGLIAGIAIITKHNIGIFIFVVAILYPILKNKKKSFTRFLFGLFPIIVFLIYLLVSKSLYKFIDLCFLNMSEFSNSFIAQPLYIVLLIITVLILLIQFIKNKSKNISYYYALAYLPVIYPLVEEYHVSQYLFFAFLVFIYNMKLSLPKKINIFSFVIIFIFIISYILIGKSYYKRLDFYSYHNFQLELLTKEEKKDYDYIIDFVNNKKVIYIGYPSKTIFFISTSQSKLDNYYILLKGNQGKNGKTKLLKRINKEQDIYFVVSKYYSCNDKQCQLDKNLLELVKKYKLIKQLNGFDIYYKESW